MKCICVCKFLHWKQNYTFFTCDFDFTAKHAYKHIRAIVLHEVMFVWMSFAFVQHDLLQNVC